MNKVTRFEYIDETGRVVVRHLKPSERIQLSYQDDYKTLKVFLLNDSQEIHPNKHDTILEIRRMQDFYHSCLEIRDWESCDWAADKIEDLRKSIGLPKASHPTSTWGLDD